MYNGKAAFAQAQCRESDTSNSRGRRNVRIVQRVSRPRRRTGLTIWHRAPLGILAMGCLGSDCGTTHFHVEITGSLKSAIVFRLRHRVDRKIRLEQLVVVEKDVSVPLGSEKIMWKLTGESTAATTTYGVAPNGLNTQVGPLPLRPRRTYSIGVHGSVRNLLRLTGSGSCEFSIGHDGAVSAPQGCRSVSN